MRPVVVLIFLSTIRSNFKQLLLNVRDSIAILIAILIYIFYFTIIGYYLFRSTLQGYVNFTSIPETYYQMAILLTTSNFPDVMLPAYYESSYSVIFFMVYLILGLYFLFNTLLATIFTNYKQRLQARAAKQEDNRTIYLEKYFNICDDDKSGYLNQW